MRVVSESEAIETLPSLLRNSDGHAIVINDGENDLRVIVSMDDYAIVRKAKVDRFLEASNILGEQIRQRAAEEGLSPEDVLRRLYPDATF